MNGLYIHIPLCKSKCIYCDFYSTTLGERKIEGIIQGLIEEYLYRRNEICDDIDTIYIGGGTPSVVPPRLLEGLIRQIPINTCKEFTIEANPDDITVDVVKSWRDMGINRVSMGVQSLSDSILKIIRRRHNAQQALDAIHILQDNGIENISCDLIYGLPGLDNEIWTDSIDTLLKQSITHLSAYCLTYNEGTVLHDKMLAGEVIPATDEEIADQFKILRIYAKLHDFDHYEISNFAKPGKQSLHNSNYWNPNSKWLGIGPSAHSFDGQIRRIDVADTTKWLAQMPAPYYIDEESDIDRLNDNIVTSLRTANGLNLLELKQTVARDILKDAKRFIDAGQMEYNDYHLCIKPENWLISDAFIRELIRI